MDRRQQVGLFSPSFFLFFFPSLGCSPPSLVELALAEIIEWHGGAGEERTDERGEVGQVRGRQPPLFPFPPLLFFPSSLCYFFFLPSADLAVRAPRAARTRTCEPMNREYGSYFSGSRGPCLFLPPPPLLLFFFF